MNKRHTCIYCNRKRYTDNMIGLNFTSWVTPVKQIKSIHYLCTDNAPNKDKSCQMLTYSMNQTTKYFFFDLNK